MTKDGKMISAEQVNEIFEVEVVSRTVYRFPAKNRKDAIAKANSDIAELKDGEVSAFSEKVMARTLTSVGFVLKD